LLGVAWPGGIYFGTVHGTRNIASRSFRSILVELDPSP
jgi:hypothetical protein